MDAPNLWDRLSRAADGWADVSGPAVRCPVCQDWSPELPDHHAAADWRDGHECRPQAITERNAA